MPFTSVIFDFDYTLADSSLGVIECANTALRSMGFPAAEGESIRKTIGFSLPMTFETLTGDNSASRAKEFVNRFHQRADNVMVDLTFLLPHVAESIEKLSRSAFLLGIVSTKHRHRIEQVLEREHLRQHFKAIVGGEDVAEHKPDPTGLLRVIELLEQPRSDVVYVGDSVVDAETAERAGVAFAAVLSGVTPRDAFSHHRSRILLKDLSALGGFLKGSHHEA